MSLLTFFNNLILNYNLLIINYLETYQQNNC